MYTPCVALNTVANIPYWASFLLMTALGIVFTIFVSVFFLVFFDTNSFDAKQTKVSDLHLMLFESLHK